MTEIGGRAHREAHVFQLIRTRSTLPLSCPLQSWQARTGCASPPMGACFISLQAKSTRPGQGVGHYNLYAFDVEGKPCVISASLRIQMSRSTN